MKKLILAHIAMFLVALFYAATFTFAKDVMNEGYLQPFGFILLRVSCAAVLFWVFHTLFIREKVKKEDLKMLAICALFGVATNMLLFFKGLNMTTPINGSLIMLTTPILVLIFGFLFYGESITLLKIAGVALGLGGAFYLTLSNSGEVTKAASNPVLGNILVGLNAASYAIYLTIVSPLMSKYNPITILKWIFTFGFIYVLPFGVGQLSQSDFASFPTYIWYLIIFVIICATFLTYLLNGSAMRVVKPSVVSSYVYLQPLLAAIIAISLGKDQLSPELIIAGCLIFVGVYLVSYRKKEKEIPKTAEAA
ncbi:MAG: DMT family transporter [Saprospiraceae bacterium]|nr:DMT family transporter [Saprospiraceae bacterium]